MKIFKNLIAQYSKQVTQTKTQHKLINVQNLINQYQDHFLQHSQKYQLPLIQQKGILAYTSRFAKTVINLQKISKDHKKSYFKRIKRSLMNHEFTPMSCVELCESLISFHFERDEEVILNRIREYVRNHQGLFSLKQKDRFQMAYKYIIIEKGKGNIKFIDMPLKKASGQNWELKMKLKHLFQLHRIGQYSYLDWQSKRQIKIQMKIKGNNTNLIIKGLNLNSSYSDILLHASRAVELANKDKAIFVIRPFKFEEVSQQDIKKELLVEQKIANLLNAITENEDNGCLQTFLRSMMQSSSLLNGNNIQVLNMTPIQYINILLANLSQQRLKQSFGYLKFNLFHQELQTLLHIFSIERRKNLKQIFKVNLLGSLQFEQKVFNEILSPLQIKAKVLLQSIEQQNLKSCHIYINETEVYEFLSYFLLFMKERRLALPFDLAQNHNLSVVKSKLSLISTIYDLQISLPAIQDHIRSYKQILYPLTFKYR